MKKHVGEFIRRKREEKGISQVDVAHMIGVTPTQVGRYEASQATPSVVIMARMADALGFTGNEVFEVLDEKSRPVISFNELNQREETK